MAISCAGDSGQEMPAPTDNKPPPTAPGTETENTAGLDEFDEALGKLLAAKCTVSAANLMQVAVADGETAYVALRTTDSKIIMNATLVSGAPCEIPSTGTVKLVAGGTAVAAGRTVLVDYASGLFAKGTSATAPGITIDFTVAATSALDSVKIRGTSGADSFAFGAGGTLGYALNTTPGVGSPADNTADVVMKNVETVIVNGGAGADVFFGGGHVAMGTGVKNNGTGTAFPGILRLYGGAGDDNLTGGIGNDTLVGGAENDVLHASLGTDTADYSARTTATTVATILGDATAVEASTTYSGDLGASEQDKVSDGIPLIKTGSGNDTVTIASLSTVSHTVSGGAGNDTMSGGATFDKFDGQTGDDTCSGTKAAMSYASRSAALTVTIGAGANDGDPAAIYLMGSSGGCTDTGTTSDDVVTVTTVTGLAAGDVGRSIVLTGFTTAANNGTYPITAVSGTTATINVSGNAMFDETSVAGTLTWSVVGELDDVSCSHVLGGSAADTITGDATANMIWGGAGNDALRGQAGDDMLYGEADNDTLYGGAGSDTLDGAAGTDTMFGGDDDDVLEGGADADAFTCDARNHPADGAIGTAPGEIDFTVDYTGSDTSKASDCDS